MSNDLSAPDLLLDLFTNDAGMADLPKADLAKPDLSMPDLAQIPPDFSIPPDLAPPPPDLLP